MNETTISRRSNSILVNVDSNNQGGWCGRVIRLDSTWAGYPDDLILATLRDAHWLASTERREGARVIRRGTRVE